jgi:hypothetical protein
MALIESIPELEAAMLALSRLSAALKDADEAVSAAYMAGWTAGYRAAESQHITVED